MSNAGGPRARADGVQFLTTRLPFRRTDLGDTRAMVDGVADATALLTDAAVDPIAFSCIAASMLAGSDAIRCCAWCSMSAGSPTRCLPLRVG